MAAPLLGLQSRGLRASRLVSSVRPRFFSGEPVCLGSLRLGARHRKFGKQDRQPKTPQIRPEVKAATDHTAQADEALAAAPSATQAPVAQGSAALASAAWLSGVQALAAQPSQLSHEPTPMGSIPFGKSASTQVVQELLQGNKAYASRGKNSENVSVSFPQLLDHVVQAQLRVKPVKAIILLDARSLTAAPTLVGALPGETRSVRVIGNVLDVNDGVAGAVEFLTEKFMPPVILILGNSGNTVVESAVRVAMTEAGMLEQVPEIHKEVGDSGTEDLLHLVRAVAPVAREALRSWPRAPFAKLVEIASQLHIWRTIENLLRSSSPVFDGVLARKIQIHGAYLNNETGLIRFLGEHPALPKLLQVPPFPQSSRTGDDPPVPADEALAQLVAGNARYAAGQGGELKPDPEVRQQLSEHGQNPVAVILGCADSRAPTEIIFDMRPGDLFVLRNAGNTCSQDGNGLLMGSVEFAVAVLRCKLIVVNGHTQCGAVTGAVQQFRSQSEVRLTIDSAVEVLQTGKWLAGILIDTPETSMDAEWVVRCDSKNNDVDLIRTSKDAEIRVRQPKPIGSIGHVLQSIMGSAKRAVSEMPGASLEDQVILATQYNVFNSIKVLLESSEIIRQSVISGVVQIHGAIYDLRTSEINWYGQHPELEDIVGMKLPLFQWKTARYRSNLGPFDGAGVARPTIKKLREGNRRFVDGTTSAKQSGTPESHPSAIVLASPEINFPIESMFDASPGSIVVQRALGGLQEGDDMLQASIEYMVLHFDPKLILVIGDSDSQLVDQALEQIHGVHTASSKTMLSIFSGVLVSALRAVNQATEESSGDTVTTEAAKQARMKRLAVELNALYTIEQLLLFSPIIRSAVENNRLELHVGLLDEHTGEVEFIGEHPMMSAIVAQQKLHGQ